MPDTSHSTRILPLHAAFWTSHQLARNRIHGSGSVLVEVRLDRVNGDSVLCLKEKNFAAAKLVALATNLVNFDPYGC